MYTWQKIGFVIVLLAVVGYFAFVYHRDGDFSSFGLPGSSPHAVSVSPTPTATAANVLKPTTVVRASTAPVSPTVLSTINARRSEAGIAPLITNSKLQNIAQSHASDMVAKGYFSHTSPSGETFQQRITASGYGGTAFAENIGLTSKSAIDIVTDWMNSAEHRKNMLNSQYGDVGIGIAHGTWQGIASVFVVAVFGHP